MAYDVELGGIELPTFTMDFREQLGSDYELVGAAAMPGAPRPMSLYDLTIQVYGDPSEVDPRAVGETKRGQLRTLLRNYTTRFEGVALAVAFDPALDGWVVIGTADLSSNDGVPPGAGDYQLRIMGAAVIPAQQTLLALQVFGVDRRDPTTPLDPQRRVYGGALPDSRHQAVARHYLPVGAYDVVGQADPVLPELEPYETVYGTGYSVTGRQHGELLRYEQQWADARLGQVRVWQRPDHANPDPPLLGPASSWVQVHGPGWGAIVGDMPVLENGRCRVYYDHASGDIVTEVASGRRYREDARLHVPYSEVARSTVLQWSPQAATVRVVVRGSTTRAELYVQLQRGWPGPAVDVYHQGRRQALRLQGGSDAHMASDGSWSHFRLGVPEREALVATRARPLVGHA